jgi:phosphoribosylamine-glycine ligase
VHNVDMMGASTTMDNATVIEYVRRVNAHTVMIGPEQPLVDGLVDELIAECPNVKAFGPTSAGARLEASKVRR